MSGPQLLRAMSDYAWAHPATSVAFCVLAIAWYRLGTWAADRTWAWLKARRRR
jgi:hypothetical protein